MEFDNISFMKLKDWGGLGLFGFFLLRLGTSRDLSVGAAIS